MGAFAKQDIVLFPFPYTDLSERKLRPCLVLSNEMQGDLILCQITSKNKGSGFAVELKKEETKEGTLSIDSFIRTNMVFTADKSQITKRVCKVTNKKYKEVVKTVLEIIS